MAIAFRGAINNAQPNGLALTISPQNNPVVGARAQVGDIIFVTSSTRNRGGNEGTIDVASGYGYTEIVNILQGNQRIHVSYKIYVSGEDSISVAGSSNASDGNVAQGTYWSGVNQSYPLDVTVTTAQAASTNPDPAAIIPANDNCMIVVLAGNSNTATSVGTITNYTLIGSVPVATDTNNANVTAAYRLLSGGAGASENPAAFSSWVTGSWVVATIALRDAAVVSGQPYAKRTGGVKNMGGYRRGVGGLWRKSLGIIRPPSLVLA